MGSGPNWRTIARRLAESCPSWGFILVDLRGHGQSQSPPPPNTVAAAADDLVRLGRSLALDIRGVMGHSFGGKVALAYVELRAGELEQAWVLDSGPGAHPGAMERADSHAVLRMLEEMPMPLPSRERFLELVAESGRSRALADWLAMNVRRAEDGFRLRMDLGVIRELFVDYFERDFWHVLERPGGAREVHVVLGGRSDSVDPGDKERLFALAQGSGNVRVHVLPQAGHWLHADDPEGLLALMRAALCGA